jgi:hypothetical protein
MAPVRIGLLLALMPLATLASPAPDREAASRFELRGTLEAIEPTLVRGRFALRGALKPAAGTGTRSGVGFSLQAALAPKGGAICLGPGHIFRNGFEAAP